MTFTQSIKTCFSKYATFSGRAPRSEYWWFTLFMAICNIVLSFSEGVQGLFYLVTFLPAIAVTTRRLHDSDKSGWWQIAPMGAVFLTVILAIVNANILAYAAGTLAVVGIILLWVWLIKPGTVGANLFGTDPLNQSPDNDDETYAPSSIPRVD